VYCKNGLDPRRYDFARLDLVPGPLWRSHDCRDHGGGYEDIVAVLETTSNVERMMRPCCLEPYNDAAKVRVVYWKEAVTTDIGKAAMAQNDREAAATLAALKTGR